MERKSSLVEFDRELVKLKKINDMEDMSRKDIEDNLYLNISSVVEAIEAYRRSPCEVTRNLMLSRSGKAGAFLVALTDNQ